MFASPLGGLEPPSFRLTAERANQLRHRGCCFYNKRQNSAENLVSTNYSCSYLGNVRDGGIVVSMVAFQAVDPGSIPGHRSIFT